MVVSEAVPDEILAPVGNHWLLWELHLPCVKNGLVSNDRHLRFIMAEGFHPEQQLVEDDTDAPDVDLQ